MPDRSTAPLAASFAFLKSRAGTAAAIWGAESAVLTAAVLWRGDGGALVGSFVLSALPMLWALLWMRLAAWPSLAVDARRPAPRLVAFFLWAFTAKVWAGFCLALLAALVLTTLALRAGDPPDMDLLLASIGATDVATWGLGAFVVLAAAVAPSAIALPAIAAAAVGADRGTREVMREGARKLHLTAGLVVAALVLGVSLPIAANVAAILAGAPDAVARTAGVLAGTLGRLLAIAVVSGYVVYAFRLDGEAGTLRHRRA